MRSDPASIRTKLPFWRTVRDAFVETFSRPGDLAKIAWFWVFVYVTVMAAFAWYSWPVDNDSTNQGDSAFPYRLLLEMAAQFFVASAIAVSWHRLLIHGEKPSSFFSIRLDRVVLLYFGWVLVMTVPVFLLVVASDYSYEIFRFFIEQALAQADTPGPESESIQIEQLEAGLYFDLFFLGEVLLSVVLAILIWAIFAFVPTRIGLLLPALAVGTRWLGAGESWRRTRGNFWRLYLGTTLIFMVTLFGVMVFGYPLGLFEDEISRLGASVLSAFISVFEMLGAVVGISFLSLAYRHFTRGSVEDRPRA